MTYLDIDVGNSFLKFRVKASTKVNKLPVIDCIDNIKWIPEAASYCRVSMVGSDEIKSSLLSKLKDRFGSNLWVAKTAKTVSFLSNGYDNYREMGVDRWMAMLAARFQSDKKLLMVVDAGTAITMDFINGDRNLGGFIVPGIQTQHSSLKTDAALNVDAPDFEGRLNFGASTKQAISNGILVTVSESIESIYKKFIRDDSDAELLLTGGDGYLISKYIKVPNVYNEHLVLDGLACQFSEEQ